MKKHQFTKALAMLLAAAMILQGNSITWAAESIPAAEQETDENKSASQETPVIDEETGLKMQVMSLDDEQEDTYSFDMDAHLSVLESKNTQTYSGGEFFSTEDATGESDIIGNQYIEFCVGQSEWDDGINGRFTIGTVEGNPNYASDDNSILMFGHPNPSTSFTTIQIDGNNYIFNAADTKYDTQNKRAESSMTVAGIKVIQTLQIVGNSSTGLEDTVRISYSVVNLGGKSKRVGIRIMLDTMLGENDGAPFKVPSRGSVTKELQLTGKDVPAYWQAFDNLTDASVFAIGTVCQDDRQRKPDKVQFASWNDIYQTIWNYTVNPQKAVTHDSAVALYWNPINLSGHGSTTVETLYGVGVSPTGSSEVPVLDVDLKDKYGLLVTKNNVTEFLAGANVTIDGIGTSTSNEHGIALFQGGLPVNGRPVRKKVTISASGYQTRVLYRNVQKEDCSSVNLMVDNGKPYVEGITVTGTNSGTFGSYVDLISENYNVTAEKNDENAYYEIEIYANANGQGNISTCKIIQNNKTLVQEKATNNRCVIRLPKKDLAAGYKIYVQTETDRGVVSERLETSMLVTAQKSIIGESSKDKKGKIKLGGTGIGFKVPDDAVAFGGMEFNMDLPYLPLDFEAFDDGKVKVSIGLDKFGNSWEKKEKEWDEILAKYERGEDISKTLTDAQNNTVDWTMTSKFKAKFVGAGYAEGSIAADGTCNIDMQVILGVKGEGSFKHQYIVGYVPLGFEFKIGTKGTYTGGCTIIIGKNSLNETKVEAIGNRGQIDVDIYANLYGGLGIVGVLTVGGEGEAHLLLAYNLQNDYYSAKVKGSLALSAKAFMFSAKYVIAERTWNLASGYAKGGSSIQSVADGAQTNFYQVIYDASSYTMMDRDYLSARSSDMFENVYPAAQPKVVNVEGTPYMFWLADNPERAAEDRTMLVYAKYNGGGWSDPAAVADDGTADFDFDVAVENSRVHVVWQNMAVSFAQTGAKSDTDMLREMSKNSDISYACIDMISGDTVTTRITDSDGIADMMPRLTLHNNQVFAAWYSNSDNDILKQGGRNQICVAEVMYTEAEAAAVDDTSVIGEETAEAEEEPDDEAEEEDQEKEPEADQKKEPEEDSEEETGKEPGEDSEEGSEKEPGEDSEEGSEKEPEKQPGEDSEKQPEEVSGKEPGEEPEKQPEGESEKQPEEEPGKQSGKEPEKQSEEEFRMFVGLDSVEEIREQDPESGGDISDESQDENGTPEDTESGSGTPEDMGNESDKPEDPESGDDTAGDTGEAKDQNEEDKIEGEETEESISGNTTESSVSENTIANTMVNDAAGEEFAARSKMTNEKQFAGTIRSVWEEEGSPVVSIAIGVLNGRITIAYVLDTDKDLTTIDDHDMYLWDMASGQVQYRTVNEVCDSNPQFSPDKSRLIWYADGRFQYLTSNTSGAAQNVAGGDDMPPASDNFRILEDNSVIWTGACMTAMDVPQYVIYKSNFSNNAYHSAYRLVCEEGGSIGDISAFVRGGETCVAYMLDDVQEESADIVYREIGAITDLTVDQADIDYTTVGAGIPVSIKADVTNSGSTDINSLNITVQNMTTGETTSWSETLETSIRCGESRELSLSRIILSQGSTGVNVCQMTIEASGESDDRRTDNTVPIEIGYTDIAVSSTPYHSDGSYFSNVIVRNNTGITASNVILRVLTDASDGAILFEKSLGDIEGYQSSVIQINLLNIVGSSKADNIYISAMTATEDYVPNNNIQMEYLGMQWCEEEKYTLKMVTRRGESETETSLGTYAAGDLIKVYVDDKRGYSFTGWSTSDGGYFYDVGNRETYFCMPAIDTTITASFVENAFIEAERHIAVGESLLIAPVYSGTWEVVGGEGAAQISYSENVAKVTGLTAGSITMTYTGSGGEGAKSVVVKVYELKDIVLQAAGMQEGDLKIRKTELMDLHASGITTEGISVELPNVTWSVANSKIAAIDGDMISGVKTGGTTLIARVGSFQKSVPVSVSVPVESLYVFCSSGTTYVPIGASLQLKATVYGYNNQKPTNRKVVWTSEDENRASVSTTGKVTAKAAGNVVIRATAADGSGKSNTFNVRVTGKVNSLTARNKLWYGYSGSTADLNSCINISGIGGSIDKQAVKWKSSNKKVVSVFGSNAYLHTRGTVTLTGSYGGKSVKIKLEVREKVRGVSITGSNYVIMGKSITLTAKPTNKNASNKKMNWSVQSAYDENGDIVSAASIAKLSSKGKITGVGKGSITVKAAAADGGGAASYKTVQVSAPIKSISWESITEKSLNMDVGDSMTVRALPLDKDENTLRYADVTYKSSNSKVVWVSGGYITALKAGKAKITASYGGKSVSLTIKVIQPVTSMTVSGVDALPVGTSAQYKVSYMPGNASTKKADWMIVRAKDVYGNVKEDTESVAVLSNGKLKAVAEGSVILRAVSKDGHNAMCQKTVKISTAPGKISVSQPNLTMHVGTSCQIDAVMTDVNENSLSNDLLTWKTSKAAVVNCENGRLTALKKGSATITASYGKKKATVKVKVIEPVENLQITGSTTMTVGKTAIYKTVIYPKTASSKTVDWQIVKALDIFDGEVENFEEIAKLTGKGKLKAVSCGTVYLRATAADGSEASDEIVVRIYGAPERIILSGRQTLQVNEKAVLSATVFDQNMDSIQTPSVTWSSSDKKTVRVDAYGNITAIKSGTAVIKAKSGGKTAEYEITVQ